MKFLRLSVLLTVAGAVAAGAALFWTSQSVQRAEDRLAALERSIIQEKQSIRVLRAEWAYLNRPERLEILATEYLGLSSAAAFNVGGGISDLPDVFIPALPAEKPVLEAQPVSMVVDGVAPNAVEGLRMSSSRSPPLPRAKPARSQSGDFGALLERVKKQRGAHDE